MTIHQIRRTTTATAETAAPTEALTRRERLETRHSREIVELLERKNELRGVHAMADFLDDAVRWSA
ncbi:hypothetical protein [Nocardioides jiangxiensis]|uniref:Uncharacterized protein n=1 Tax=Nocardioides jiangxiensis TaxID=3064524 RepID=A0ABT9AZL0_9ACTN|nr:hypothetical protein [Nocardioides sp. WY-20]MDO7867984.1 hypothetical protein [Nocardioides sp. WY-20]